MAKFTRLQVYHKISAHPMVPVFYHSDIQVCKRVVEACYAGGVRVFEFTNRGDFAHETFAELVKWADKELPDLALGAGTVVDGATAALFMQLGANFIVSPVVKEDMAKICNRRKVAWLPGTATLTEINYAEELGAEIVKVFPGFVLGPAFVEAAKGPFPWTSIMPTGGVEPTEESLTKWFKAGVTCVGIGSQLFPKEILQKSDYNWITNKVADCFKVIALLKS
jgi:2-dehydro-3-deoxyphosphogluconate aldolase/(4S)-4-hydroxy-2-oxoglutarate aldolase